MPIITNINREDAATLGRKDRASFDTAYNAWLATDAIDGTPDYTDHLREQDIVFTALIGATYVERIKSRLAKYLEADDLDAYDVLEAEMDALYKAYTDAFGELPK